MKRIESHAEENAFFRLEMLARKHKEPWPQKGLYWLYEILSDYGQSIFRPLAWLIIFSIAFHGVYLRLGLPKDQAMDLALENTLIFPGMFSGGLDDGMELTGLKIVLVGGSALAFECGIVVFDAAWISQSVPPEIIDSCGRMINLCPGHFDYPCERRLAAATRRRLICLQRRAPNSGDNRRR